MDGIHLFDLETENVLRLKDETLEEAMPASDADVEQEKVVEE